MTTPDDAYTLYSAHQNLLTGICECIFHKSCMRYLFDHSKNQYECKKCDFFCPTIKNLSNRNCLCCAAYTPQIMCDKCTKTFVQHLLQKSVKIGQLHLVNEVTAFFYDKKLHIYLQPFYTVWLILEMRQMRLPIFSLNETTTLHNPVSILAAIISKTVKKNHVVSVQRLKKETLNLLEPLFHFNNHHLQEALHYLKIYCNDLTINEDCIKLANNLKHRQRYLDFPVLGSNISNANALTPILLAKNKHVKKIFLSEKNDYMYYLTLKEKQIIIPDFRQLWINAALNCVNSLYK